MAVSPTSSLDRPSLQVALGYIKETRLPDTSTPQHCSEFSASWEWKSRTSYRRGYMTTAPSVVTLTPSSAYNFIAKESPLIGLSLVPSKLSVWSATPPTSNDPLQSGIPCTPRDGFVLLGAPIGTAAFSNATLGDRIDKIEAALKLLPSMEDS